MWRETAARVWSAAGAMVLIVLGLATDGLSQPPQLNPARPVQPLAPPPLPTPVPAPTAAKPAAEKKTSASSALIPTPEKLGEQATQLLRGLLPREYENRKKWGLTSRVVSGVDIDRDGLKIKTHRRWKEVNDGLWKRYHATLVDPDERLELQVVRIEEVEPGRVQMDAVLVAALDLEGRVVKYKRNLRLLSLTARADATIKLELQVELGARLDPTKLPPDIVLDVEVKDAKLDLVHFRLRRLSDIKGGAAQQLGKLVDEIAEDEIKDQRVKLVEKLNKKIEKKSDQLRFSFHDLLPESLQTNPKETEKKEALSVDADNNKNSPPPSKVAQGAGGKSGKAEKKR